MKNEVLVKRNDGKVRIITGGALLEEVVVDGQTYYKPIGQVKTEGWYSIKEPKIIECAGKAFLCEENEAGKFVECYSVYNQRQLGVGSRLQGAPQTYYTIEEQNGEAVIRVFKYDNDKEIGRVIKP